MDPDTYTTICFELMYAVEREKMLKLNDVDDIREKLMGIGTITQVHIPIHVTNVAAVACILKKMLHS